jgi:hypothetical protein
MKEPCFRAPVERRVRLTEFERNNMETLADALPKEQQRVRDLLPIYDAIPTGVFAATMMRQSLALAEQAAASGDVAAMIAAYEDLKGYDA